MRAVSLLVSLLALSVATVQAQSPSSQQSQGATRPRIVAAVRAQAQQTPVASAPQKQERATEKTGKQAAPATVEPVAQPTPIELAGIEAKKKNPTKSQAHENPQPGRS